MGLEKLSLDGYQVWVTEALPPSSFRSLLAQLMNQEPMSRKSPALPPRDIRTRSLFFPLLAVIVPPIRSFLCENN